MEEAKHRGCGGVADNHPKNPGAEAIAGKAITMVEGSCHPAKRQVGTVGMKGRAKLLPPEPTTPSIVVATDNRDVHTRSADACESLEGGEGSACNDGTVFEPELEEVAVDHQMLGDVGHLVEEAVERCLDLGSGKTEVSVGDDEGDGWHGRSIGGGTGHRQPVR
jgi:hypothetical protein